MKKLIKFLVGVGAGSLLLGFLVGRVEKGKEKKDTKAAGIVAEMCESQENRGIEEHLPYGVYEKYLKRPFDFTIALTVLVFLFPVLVILDILIWIKLGRPVIFIQNRPGKDGRIFKLYKFRTMTNERNERGELLPDDVRLTEFGKKLRSTSLDELPELFNILKGEMSLVGPRPLLLEYLPLYNKRQARRHEVRPGLTGLAQVSGRNSISWEEKFEDDVRYVDHISFFMDMKILFQTVTAVIKREGISSSTAATMEVFMGNGEHRA